MTKRIFDLDDDLLRSAQERLGTPTMSATVREALRRAAADPVDRYMDALGRLDPNDLPEVRRPRAFD